MFSPAMMSIWKSLYLRFFVRHTGGPGAFRATDPDAERSDGCVKVLFLFFVFFFFFCFFEETF